jgi:hypothetical protein
LTKSLLLYILGTLRSGQYCRISHSATKLNEIQSLGRFKYSKLVFSIFLYYYYYFRNSESAFGPVSTQRFKPFDLDESDLDSDQVSDLEESTEDWHASDPGHGDGFFGLKLIADHAAVNDHGRPSGYGLDKNDLSYDHGKNKVKKDLPVMHQDNKLDPEHRQADDYEPGRHRTAPVYRQRAMTPWPVSHESTNASARESKSISRYRAAPKT